MQLISVTHNYQNLSQMHLSLLNSLLVYIHLLITRDMHTYRQPLYNS